MDILILIFIAIEIMGNSLGISIGEIENNQSHIQECQHLMTYEEIYYLLTHSPCASHLPLRTKRDDNTEPADSTSNVYALQSTINDHRTMIDDHRKMIHYLINNTVNITQLNEYYTEQHAKMAPIWKSWRDVSLLLLIIVSFCVILWFLTRRFHPLDMLTSILLRRYQNKQKQQLTTSASQRKHKEMPPISNIEREYMRYERDSNSLFQD